MLRRPFGLGRDSEAVTLKLDIDRFLGYSRELECDCYEVFFRVFVKVHSAESENRIQAGVSDIPWLEGSDSPVYAP